MLVINIHIFGYPDPRLSALFRVVPTSPDNRGSTVLGKIIDALADEGRMLKKKPMDRLFSFRALLNTTHLGLTHKRAISQANINAIPAI